MSVPPMLLMLGMSAASSERSTAALTANPDSPLRELTVGSRMQGKAATTAAKSCGVTLSSTMTRNRDSRTDFSSMTRFSTCWRRVGSSRTAGWTYRRVEEVIRSAMISRLFERSVAPVEVLSMMQSASSGGKTSVAP